MDILEAKKERIRRDAKTYIEIMETIDAQKKAPETCYLDEDFQKKFCRFYQLTPYRDSVWQGRYFSVFSKMIRCPSPNFGTILHKLYRFAPKNGKKYIEMSFSSKMLATLDPERPIWDQICAASSASGKFPKNLLKEDWSTPSKPIRSMKHGLRSLPASMATGLRQPLTGSCRRKRLTSRSAAQRRSIS